MAADPAQRFDLSDDLKRQRRRDWRTTIPWAVALLVLGAFCLLGAAVLPGLGSPRIVILLVGFLFTVFPGTALVLSFVGPIRAIAVTAAGIEVDQAHRRRTTLAWSDPRLGIRITEFTANATRYFSPSDPPYAQPQWLFLSPPIREETTVPPALVTALIEGATAHGVRVEQVSVLVYSTAGGKEPNVSFTSRRIGPGDSTVPNGRVTLIGPTAEVPGDSAL